MIVRLWLMLWLMPVILVAGVAMVPLSLAVADSSGSLPELPELVDPNDIEAVQGGILHEYREDSNAILVTAPPVLFRDNVVYSLLAVMAPDADVNRVTVGMYAAVDREAWPDFAQAVLDDDQQNPLLVNTLYQQQCEEDQPCTQVEHISVKFDQPRWDEWLSRGLVLELISSGERFSIEVPASYMQAVRDGLLSLSLPR